MLSCLNASLRAYPTLFSSDWRSFSEVFIFPNHLSRGGRGVNVVFVDYSFRALSQPHNWWTFSPTLSYHQLKIWTFKLKVMRLCKVELLTYNQWAWRIDYYLGQQMTSNINFEIIYASHLNISVNSYVKQGEVMEHGYETSDVASY